MSEPAALPAQYVKLSTLVDGTVRIILDVPREYFAHASAMFDKPGVSVGLARLKDDARGRVSGGGDVGERLGSSQPAASPPSGEKRDFYQLNAAMRAALLCKRADFQQFLVECHHSVEPSEQAAAQTVRLLCNVSSRAGLNHSPDAAWRWELLEKSFNEWKRSPAFS